MEYLIGPIIAGVVAFFVVQDAKSLREEELGLLGASGVSPGMWGAGVFLLMIVFLPGYLVFRTAQNKKLIDARLSMNSPVAPAPVVLTSASRSINVLDEIGKAHELHAAGALTEQEYEELKNRILATTGGER